jgi:hypothetical protein
MVCWNHYAHYRYAFAQEINHLKHNRRKDALSSPNRPRNPELLKT